MPDATPTFNSSTTTAPSTAPATLRDALPPRRSPQTWIWTALPNGVSIIDGEHYLSLNIVVSPRLHVSRLTDQWRRWPLTAENDIRFAVRFHFERHELDSVYWIEPAKEEKSPNPVRRV